MRNKFFLLISIALFSDNLFALADINLKLRASVKTVHSVEDAHCHPVNGCDGTYISYDQTDLIEQDLVTSFSDSSRILSVSSTYYPEAAPIHQHMSVNLEAKTIVQGISTLESLTVSSSKPEKLDRRYHSKPNSCCHNWVTEKMVSNDLSGTIKLSYTVPTDIHLLKIHVVKRDGLFLALDYPSLTGVLNDYKTSSEYIWVKPGSVVQLVFQLPKGKGLNYNGGIQYRFEPIPAPNAAKLDNFLASFTNKAIDYEKVFPKGAENFFLNLVYHLHNEDQLKDLVKMWGIDQLSRHIRFFTSILIGNQYFDSETDIKLILDTKAAAALYLFRLGEVYLNHIGAYCGEFDMNLPFDGSTKKVNGIEYIYFLTKQIESSILRFPEQIHREYLNFYQTELADKSMTYSEVVQNPELVIKLKKAHDLFLNNAAHEQRFFSQALLYVDQLLNNFPNSPVIPEVREIRRNLVELQEMETSLGESEMEFVYNFRLSNQDIVDPSLILKKLNDIEFKSSSVRKQSQNAIAIGSDGAGGLDEMLLSIKSTILSLFEQPSRVSYFESVRRSYTDDETLGRNIQLTINCLNLEM